MPAKVADNGVQCLSIVCRFVSTDQWLTTHLNPDWKVSQAKLYLLSKFLPHLVPAPPLSPPIRKRKRRGSPIQFASRAEAAERDREYGEEEDIYVEEDLFDDSPKKAEHKALPPRQSSSSIRPDSEEREAESTDSRVRPGSYILVSFSTGMTFDDELQIKSCEITQKELLELHIAPYVVNLHRSSPRNYILPYFEAEVYALRESKRVDGELEGELRRRDHEIRNRDDQRAAEPPTRKERLKKRLARHEWKKRWLIIHDGQFILSVQRRNLDGAHNMSLSSLVALRGAEYLSHSKLPVHKASMPPSTASSPKLAHFDNPFSSDRESSDTSHPEEDPKIVCLKFRTSYSSRMTQSRPSIAGMSVPSVMWPRRSSGDKYASDVLSTKTSRTTLSEAENELEDSQDEPVNEGGAWTVVKLLDNHVYECLLRILHRDASGTLPSGFMPDTTVISHSVMQDPPSPIFFASRSSIPDSPLNGSDDEAQFRTPAPRAYHPSFDQPTVPTPYPRWRRTVLKQAREQRSGASSSLMLQMAYLNGEIGDGDLSSESTQEDVRGRAGHPPSSFPARLKTQSSRSTTGSQFDTESIKPPPSHMPDDEDDLSSSEGSHSEMEWSNWLEDVRLKRQRARKAKKTQPIQYDSDWNWQSASQAGDSASQTSGASSPHLEGSIQDISSTMLNVSHSLASYSSNESLMRATIARNGSGRSSEKGKARSPFSSMRNRPRSPLSSELEERGEGHFHSAMFPTPNYSYPQQGLRSQHSEGALAQASGPFTDSPQRAAHRAPMTMAMTTITSTVSVGDPKEAKAKRKERKRSSTVVARPPLRAASSGHGADQNRYSVVSSSSSQITTKGSTNETFLKPEPIEQSNSVSSSSSTQSLYGKPKLTLSVGRVTDIASSSSRLTPAAASAASSTTSSFESPQFAKPDNSDSE